MVNEIKNSLNGSGLKVAIAVARFNEIVTDKLLEGALRQLGLLGVADKDITVVRVPGAFIACGVRRHTCRYFRRRFDCRGFQFAGCSSRDDLNALYLRCHGIRLFYSQIQSLRNF